jgi:hypothetical protein
MATLLEPPTPPFVCGIPLYGISHGGESTSKEKPEQGPNYLRTWWPGEAAHAVPLTKLQSKHVAIYSRVALSRDRYPVQVNDALDFVLDREVWFRARDLANLLMRALVDDGVKGYPAKLALSELRIPFGASSATAARWPMLTAPLRQHYRATWWRLFVEFIPTLEGATNDTTGKRLDDRTASEGREGDTTPARAPAARDQEADPRRTDREGQVLLPGF